MSPPATLLDPRTAETLDKIEQDGEQRYRDLVIAMTEGKTPKPAELREALLGSSRTRDDLARHLAHARSQIDAAEDLQEAKAIQSQLPELQTASDDANEAVEKLREKHQKTLEPLLEAQHKTFRALEASRKEARQLEREAISVLSKGKSSTYTDRWKRLSTTTCKLAEKLRAAKLYEGKHTAERESAVADRDWWQSELDRAGEKEGLDNARENFGIRLDKATARIKTAERKIGEVRDLEEKHQEASGALKDFEADNFTDWKQMKFD
ncbi:MAG: hypothetical protein GXP24_06430 [Planctomycetes bacterium]|nr:hypothetical protein [Planctomycetota bacterium]